MIDQRDGHRDAAQAGQAAGRTAQGAADVELQARPAHSRGQYCDIPSSRGLLTKRAPSIGAISTPAAALREMVPRRARASRARSQRRGRGSPGWGHEVASPSACRSTRRPARPRSRAPTGQVRGGTAIGPKSAVQRAVHAHANGAAGFAQVPPGRSGRARGEGESIGLRRRKSAGGLGDYRRTASRRTRRTAAFAGPRPWRQDGGDGLGWLRCRRRCPWVRGDGRRNSLLGARQVARSGKERRSSRTHRGSLGVTDAVGFRRFGCAGAQETTPASCNGQG